MADARQWLAGTRPRTLPAAVVPVLIGSGVALGYGRFSWWRALLALVVALALQIGVNFANDYSDGVRGSDAKRVGPVRLVAAVEARKRPGINRVAEACLGEVGPQPRTFRKSVPRMSTACGRQYGLISTSQCGNWRARSAGLGLVSRASPVQTAMRNCTRDEGWSFEFDNQVDLKPPQAAVVKSHGGERCGKVGT